MFLAWSWTLSLAVIAAIASVTGCLSGGWP